MSIEPGRPGGFGAFEVLPAIDLREGRVVRLTGGDFDRETGYQGDPATIAERFVGLGARAIHVVDLDGARDGRPRQGDVVRAVVERVGDRAACQVAGGLRDERAVDEAIAAGAKRVVIGTAALTVPGFAARIAARHGAQRVVVALDVRQGLAVGEGWRSGSPGVPVEDALRNLAGDGVVRFAVTAIERDGALVGPDLPLVGRLAVLGHGEILAAGGIRSIADLLALRDAGAAGAIVGKALYEHRLDLAAALAALA